MYKVVYKEKSILFQENVNPPGWHPLWNDVKEVFSDKEVTDEILSKLSQNDQELVSWFFLI